METEGKEIGVAVVRRGWFVRALAVAMALALAVGLLPLFAQPAFAYYNFGTVGVNLGAGSVDVQKGGSTRVSVNVTPASDQQTRGCGMAKCPQVCSTEGAIAAGYTCFDTNGQCTCAGTDYSTYYPTVSASSSNSSIARATVSGSTLDIVGVNPGTATITVNASLRQWTSSSATIQVNVKAAGGSSSSYDFGGSAGSSSSASGGSTVINTSNANMPSEATDTDSRDDILNEQVIETVAGKVYVAECNSHLNAIEEMAKVKGTGDQVILWSGPSSTNPDYSWTFYGEDIPDNIEEMTFDPTIALSKMGTGFVANIMSQAKDGVVMDFNHEGALPCKGTLYVNVDSAFDDGQMLSLFCYDDAANVFDPVLDQIEVVDGYATFKIEHCSTWAFSTDSLDGYVQSEVNTPGAVRATELSVSQTPAWVVPAAVAIVLAAVAAFVLLVLFNRRKRVKSSSVAAAEASVRNASDGEGWGRG